MKVRGEGNFVYRVGVYFIFQNLCIKVQQAEELVSLSDITLSVDPAS